MMPWVLFLFSFSFLFSLSLASSSATLDAYVKSVRYGRARRLHERETSARHCYREGRMERIVFKPAEIQSPFEFFMFLHVQRGYLCMPKSFSGKAHLFPSPPFPITQRQKKRKNIFLFAKNTYRDSE